MLVRVISTTMLWTSFVEEGVVVEKMTVDARLQVERGDQLSWG